MGSLNYVYNHKPLSGVPCLGCNCKAAVFFFIPLSYHTSSTECHAYAFLSKILFSEVHWLRIYWSILMTREFSFDFFYKYRSLLNK
jgi:hypothetical protein